MGAGGSKPESASKHVFSSNTPVQFSQELVDSLQDSTETNSTRAKSLELHVASRVAAELAALQKREDDALKSLTEKISLDNTSSSSSSTASPPSEGRLLDLPSVPAPADAAAREEARQAQSSAKVFEELEKLKRGLEGRKKVRDLPVDVGRSRDEVVRCLRLKDRRPLDCWREVEAFKLAVGRMEDDFIRGVL